MIRKLMCLNKRFLQINNKYSFNIYLKQLCSSLNNVNSYVSRSHTCGELCPEHVGLNVTLYGWVQYQRLGRFITIRDAYGTTQLLLNKKLSKEIGNLMSESVIQVNGTVKLRPEKDINNDLKTGKIEVHCDTINVLNRCRSDAPFVIRDYHSVGERVRLENRYLDLRGPLLQHNLRLRSNVIMKMRQFLHNHGFVEIETPSLFKRTPGGAQEFVVPTQFPGQFYSLTQSPQQLKQLLMIGAFDRYYQIARCFRDEGTKPDRQPEFTQLDLEMTFTTEDQIMTLIEDILCFCWPNNVKIKVPFPRMKYEDAFRVYGSDKPDIRYGMELHDISSLITTIDDQSYIAMVVPKGCMIIKDELLKIVNDLPLIKSQQKFNGNIFYFEVNDNVQWIQNECIRNFPNESINAHLSVGPNDFIWICEANKIDARHLMGRIRTECVRAYREIGSKPLIDETHETLSFLWIVDFPLFKMKDDGSEVLESNHHPFTAPKNPESIYSDPMTAIAKHYDLVLNGQEVGGGSIRIHDSQLQEYVLKDILKEDTESMEYFFNALKSGCPPHGGIALGLDRIIAIMCNARSIRDVIAFPKSAHGKDLMSGAPSVIPDSVKNFYGIITKDI